MKILGIETSCDETAIALLSGQDDNLTVEDSVVFSQIDTHAEFGGVVPEVAARLHLEKLIPMLADRVPRDGQGIDAIAVTAGPGLAPALRTGVEVAKTLAWLWEKPLVPVSHLEGHIYASWLSEVTTPSPSLKRRGNPEFPALCLIVSGGHTELIVMKGHGDFERIGETLDDAAGEAFDKVASMIGLGYPGGPKLAALAEEGNKHAFDFPRAMIDKPNFDFSFSGLKTSVMYFLRELEGAKGTIRQLESQGRTRPSVASSRDGLKADVAASFQEAVVEVLVTKTIRAAKKVKPASIILAGGVAANKELRARMKHVFEDSNPPSSPLGQGGERIPVHIPPMKYSTDNAAMIAAVGYFRAQKKENIVDPLTLKANPNLDF